MNSKVVVDVIRDRAVAEMSAALEEQIAAGGLEYTDLVAACNAVILQALKLGYTTTDFCLGPEDSPTTLEDVRSAAIKLGALALWFTTEPLVMRRMGINSHFVTSYTTDG